MRFLAVQLKKLASHQDASISSPGVLTRSLYPVALHRALPCLLHVLDD